MKTLRQALPAVPGLTCLQGEPRESYRRWQRQAGRGDALLVVEFELTRYWLDAAAPLPLTALYCLSGGRLQLAVTDLKLDYIDLPPADLFAHWVERHRLLVAEPGAALELPPHVVDKPWGRELWYSGVESRGVCEVGAGDARVPLPWLQAAFPEDAAGPAGQPPILLKRLEPSSQPVLGDLYFELHETKSECYVVTEVDPVAWPGGTGGMRYGFNQAERAARGDDRRFLADYLAAVQAYEKVRRQLDGDGMPDPLLRRRERELREHMDGFTHLRPLRRGDVVQVPPRLPHALQHGVSVVEVQTPVYERSILSFAQQVLTQPHWDTEAALDSALLSVPEQAPVTALPCGPGVRGERLARCADFEVRRYRIEGSPGHDPGPLPGYALVMVLEGEMTLDRCHYGAGRALLLTRGWQGVLVSSEAARPLVLLLAMPPP